MMGLATFANPHIPLMLLTNLVWGKIGRMYFYHSRLVSRAIRASRVFPEGL
jgi:hypothetical protein